MDQLTIGDYIYEPIRIGRGSFSEVFKGFHIKTNEIFAVKKIDLNNKVINNRIKYEINLMKTLNHENIVKLYDYVYKRDDLYLILEYCEKGDLGKFLNHKPLKEKYVKKYMKQLSNGLQYLGMKNIIHRDLKPQNILIGNDGLLKITDFSFAKILNDKDEDLLQTICGSPLYMSPEIIKYKNYSNKSDLWSIGMILYEMLTGKSPYNASTHYELMQKIETQPVIIPKCINISNNCTNLLHGLLQRKVHLRINWEDFFNHPWINDNITINLHTSNDKFSYITNNKSTMIDDIKKKIELPIIKMNDDFVQMETLNEEYVTNTTAIDIKNTINDNYFINSNEQLFNKSIDFTPNEINGFIVVENNFKSLSNIDSEVLGTNDKEVLNKKNNERTLGSSLYNYMNQSINYFKTYIKTLPNPEYNDYL